MYIDYHSADISEILNCQDEPIIPEDYSIDPEHWIPNDDYVEMTNSEILEILDERVLNAVADSIDNYLDGTYGLYPDEGSEDRFYKARARLRKVAQRIRNEKKLGKIFNGEYIKENPQVQASLYAAIDNKLI